MRVPIFPIIFGLGLSAIGVFASAADISVVLDDSSGMCGYLDAPLAQNPYKLALMKLQEARNTSGKTIEVFYLSDLKKPLSSGLSFDTVVASNAKNCPFKATSSPLHNAFDTNILNKSSVILITDLLFDGGSSGSSDSRSKFIDQFDALRQNTPKTSKSWFSVSAGLMGVKSPFRGSYFSSTGQQKVDLSQAVERPFYVVWKSSDSKFATFLNQMGLLWTVPDWKKKRNSDEGAVAFRFLPTSDYLLPKDSFYVPPITPLFEQRSLALGKPTVLYGKSSGKLLDPVLPPPQVVSAEAVNPQECFEASNQFNQLMFKASCAKDGAREDSFFDADQPISSVIIAYPLLKSIYGVKRSLKIDSLAGSFGNNAEIYLRDYNQSEAVRYVADGKKLTSGVILKIGSIRGAKSIFSNHQTRDNVLSYRVSENYEPINSSDLLSSVQKISAAWSTEIEPCLKTDKTCHQANSATYQLSGLLNSMIVRLSANQHTANILNKESIGKYSEVRIVKTQ
jgi:hypothetical protein